MRTQNWEEKWTETMSMSTFAEKEMCLLHAFQFFAQLVVSYWSCAHADAGNFENVN